MSSSYARAHAAKQRAASQDQERRAVTLQRHMQQHAKQALAEGGAERSSTACAVPHGATTAQAAEQHYGAANRVRALGAASQQRENDYIQATEARMGRERQLRLETQRRRKAARRRRMVRKRIEEEKREKQLKARQKKKGAYVNYIRKHLTKMTVRPQSGAAPSSSASTRRGGSVRAQGRSASVSVAKTARGSNSGRRVTPSRRTWTKKPSAVPQSQRIKRQESAAASSSSSSKNSENATAADGPAVAPRQTSNLLRDLRAQMRRNEKLRCSIEALDLQVKLRKEPMNTTRDHLHKGPASASTFKRKVEDAGNTFAADSYEAEGISESLPVDDNFGLSSSEEEDDEIKEDKIVAVSNTDSRPAREVQEVLVQTADASSRLSPSSPPRFYSGHTKDGTTATTNDRGDPPMAPPLSPSSFSLDVVSKDTDDSGALKDNKDGVVTPTWIRTLDPAPTKIFDSLDLSMTMRQSIEVERNRRRAAEEEERGDDEEESEKQHESHIAFDDNLSPKSFVPSASPGAGENAVRVNTPRKHDNESNNDDDELVSLKVTSSNALTPGSHVDMKYNSMRTHAPTSPCPSGGRSIGGICEEASQMTVASTATTTTQVSEGGYAFLRQRALDRKKRSEEKKQKRRLAHKRKMMMMGLMDNGGGGGGGNICPQGSASTLVAADGSKTLDLRKRASWGRDVARMSPRRRARREAAQRRKEYEKMINMQMKEERLQRRRTLQRQRKQLREQESRVLMQQQYQHQHRQHEHFYQPHMGQEQQQQQQQPLLPAAQWQQNQPYQSQRQAMVPSHDGAMVVGSNIPQNPSVIQEEAPPSESRPLGRDYGRARRGGFRGDIDPRSTISIEEDRLRGSLMRLEHRLEQTRVRKLGGTRRGERKSREARRGKGSRYAGINSENVPNDNILPPGLIGGGRQQEFMHTEKGNGADILRYPVAQQQQLRQLVPQQFAPLPMRDDDNKNYSNRAAARYTGSGEPSTTTTNVMHRPPATVSRNEAGAAFRVHAPTEVKVLRPMNGFQPAEVQLSYSVMPMHMATTGTDNDGSIRSSNAPGYSGLREHRQASHMQRLATMRPVSQQQPRASRMASGAQRARPVSQQQPRSATLRHHQRNTMHRQPKGSLHQKPRTRRVVLGKTKKKPTSKVRTSGLVQVDSNKLHLLLSP